MPLIRIENWPETWPTQNVHAVACTTYELAKLAKDLQRACIKARVPGIDSEKLVTVTLGGQQILQEDSTMVVIVEGLFDRTDRTKEIRDRLAELLAKVANHYLRDLWKVEVLIYRFNPEVDSYTELLPESE